MQDSQCSLGGEVVSDYNVLSPATGHASPCPMDSNNHSALDPPLNLTEGVICEIASVRLST